MCALRGLAGMWKGLQKALGGRSVASLPQLFLLSTHSKPAYSWDERLGGFGPFPLPSQPHQAPVPALGFFECLFW